MVGPWLIDKSAYVRLSSSADPGAWMTRIERGLLHVATVTVLEVGYSARYPGTWVRSVEEPQLSTLPLWYCTPQAEKRAVQVQGLLAARGQHRAPSIPDLLIAAIAEAADLTVLHVDRDFELIAEITGQPMERLELAE